MALSTSAAAAPQEVTRRAKVALLRSFAGRVGSPPNLIILGSSRAMRADPAVLRKALHVRAFNAAVSSGSVPDAYAYLKLARRRYPRTRLSVLWFLDIEAMRLGGYQPYLLSVPALAACLPPGASRRPPGASAVSSTALLGGARGGTVRRPQFRPDGLLLWWWHDWQRANGRTTTKGVSYQIRQYSDIYKRPGSYRISGSSKWYATQIVRHANQMGATPVIVLTPYHPQLRSHIERHGWRRAYDDVRRFFRQLRSRYELRLVDLTSLRSFGGWPEGFYDGVHPRPAMMRAILRAVVRRAGRHLTPSVQARTAASTLSPADLVMPFGAVPWSYDVPGLASLFSLRVP